MGATSRLNVTCDGSAGNAVAKNEKIDARVISGRTETSRLPASPCSAPAFLPAPLQALTHDRAPWGRAARFRRRHSGRRCARGRASIHWEQTPLLREGPVLLAAYPGNPRA